MYTRIKTFIDAQTALVGATKELFSVEDNWKLHVISRNFRYKIPVEFAKIFFRGRASWQQSGFESIYGSSFTLVLKLLQAYTLELALSTLDKKTECELVEKFQTEEYLRTLDKLETEEQLAEVFDDILLAANSKELVLLRQPVIEPLKYETDVNGKLAFLKWLIKSLNEQVPNPDTMKVVKDYTNRLYSIFDRQLIELLNTIYSLYWNPEGYFENVPSAKRHIDEQIEKLKRDFPFELKVLNILRLFPETLINDCESFAAADTELSKLALQKIYIKLTYLFDSFIVKCRLTEHFFDYNGVQLNFGNTYYKVLDRVAYLATGEKMPSADEAFVLLGLDKNTTTFELFMLMWKLEQKQFAVWLDQYWKTPTDTLTTEQKSFNDEVIQAHLQKFLAFRVIFKSHAFPKEFSPPSSEFNKQDFLAMLGMLGIDLKDWPELSSDKINTFYRKAARRLHPDKAADKVKATADFQLLKKYQETLLRLKSEGIGYDDLPDAKVEKRHKDELADPPVDDVSEKILRPNSLALANIAGEGYFTAEQLQFSLAIASQIGNAKGYLEERRLSSWLVKSGYGGVVKFFSPLRYHKIIVTLAYLNNLEPKDKDASSTGHIIDLLKSDNIVNLRENYQTVKQNIKEAVKREKMKSIEGAARAKTEYLAKHAQIPLPFFWRFADISRDADKVLENVKRRTEEALNHDGVWSKLIG